MKFLPFSKSKICRLGNSGSAHIGALLIIVTLVAVAGAFTLVQGNADALSKKPTATHTKPKPGKLVIFSDNATYNAVKIRVSGGVPKAYQCGGSFNSTTGFTKQQSLRSALKTKGVVTYPPLVLSCSPISGAASYEVYYGKGQRLQPGPLKETFNTTYTAVDVDSGYCTFVHVDPAKTRKVPETDNGCKSQYAGEDPVVKKDVGVQVLPAYSKGSTITGYFGISVKGTDLNREQCSGSVRIDNSYSDGTKAYSYSKPLKYVKIAKYNDGNGYCVATLSTKVAAKRSAPVTVSINGAFVGSPYLNPAAGGAPIVVPANAKTSARNGTGGSQAPTKITPSVRVLLSPTTAKSTKITGFFEVAAPGVNLPRQQCTGSAAIVITSTANGKVTSRSNSLKYVKVASANDGNGYCVATLSIAVPKYRDTTTTYTVSGSLPKTKWFNNVSAVGSVSVPANPKPVKAHVTNATGGVRAPN